MIFLTVGTQLPFDRLVRGVDMWAAEHPDVPVRAQIGTVGERGYQPQYMDSSASLAPEEFDRLCQKAQLVVAHAGTGSLIKALSVGTPILAMPRKGALGEHRNDHQIATAEHFQSRPGIHIVYEADDLAPMIDHLLSSSTAAPALKPYADDALLAAIRAVVFPER